MDFPALRNLTVIVIFYVCSNILYLQIKKEREELYKPKLLIDINVEHWKQKEREREREIERQRARERERDREAERELTRLRIKEERERYMEIFFITIIAHNSLYFKGILSSKLLKNWLLYKLNPSIAIAILAIITVLHHQIKIRVWNLLK